MKITNVSNITTNMAMTMTMTITMNITITITTQPTHGHAKKEIEVIANVSVLYWQQ